MKIIIEEEGFRIGKGKLLKWSSIEEVKIIIDGKQVPSSGILRYKESGKTKKLRIPSGMVSSTNNPDLLYRLVEEMQGKGQGDTIKKIKEDFEGQALTHRILAIFYITIAALIAIGLLIDFQSFAAIKISIFSKDINTELLILWIIPLLLLFSGYEYLKFRKIKNKSR
ncbi:MAG: hypothetical protein WBM02_00765 [bacterium]